MLFVVKCRFASLNKGASMIIGAVVVIVLAIGLLAFGVFGLKKIQNLYGTPFDILMQQFDIGTTELERSILCSYLRCKLGCGVVASPQVAEELHWKNVEGKSVNCGSFCPEGYDKVCRDDAIKYPIEIGIEEKMKLSKTAIDRKTVVISEKRCIVTEKLEQGWPYLGKVHWIRIKSDYLDPQTITTKKCGGIKNAVLSTEVNKGSYYIFTIEDTTCILDSKTGEEVKRLLEEGNLLRIYVLCNALEEIGKMYEPYPYP